MNTRKKIFKVSLPIIISLCSLFTVYNCADAARTAVRGAPVARKPTIKVQQQKTEDIVTESEETSDVISAPETPDAEEVIIENKAAQFDDTVSEIVESSNSDDDVFAESIRRQRAALNASEASMSLKSSQQSSLKNGHNACDSGLRECMINKCGNDFTKCATDGDTMFGDKLNGCRRDIECTGEEFRLFTTEIKADRDMNVKLSSYNMVIDCGNTYNKCIENECGQTFNKCLGKAAADVAIQKCASVAKNCTEADSGLTSRVNTVIGKLRESAEKDVKKDEERMYALRDLMRDQCKSLGAAFDERSFDCVYTVNFFAGENQSTPMASRKRYAGDAFICMQEWFGINATTFKENAYRETRAQTAASSAMLGAGVGTAAGLVTSGAIGRALDTQKAKKALKKAEEEANQTKTNSDDDGDKDSNGQNDPTPQPESPVSDDPKPATPAEPPVSDDPEPATPAKPPVVANPKDCTEFAKEKINHLVTEAVVENGKCVVKECEGDYYAISLKDGVTTCSNMTPEPSAEQKDDAKTEESVDKCKEPVFHQPCTRECQLQINHNVTGDWTKHATETHWYKEGNSWKCVAKTCDTANGWVLDKYPNGNSKGQCIKASSKKSASAGKSNSQQTNKQTNKQTQISNNRTCKHDFNITDPATQKTYKGTSEIKGTQCSCYYKTYKIRNISVRFTHEDLQKACEVCYWSCEIDVKLMIEELFKTKKIPYWMFK